MRAFTISAFDEILIGTATTWYTSADYNALLGSADWIGLYAVTSSANGTSPTLTCQIEHSGDARNWVTLLTGTTTEIDHQPISTSQETALASPQSPAETLLDPVMLRFVRVKMFLGGTAPQCRLKLYITGRVVATAQPARSAAAAGAPREPRESGPSGPQMPLEHPQAQTYLPSRPRKSVG